MSTLFITGQPRAGKTTLCVEREMLPSFRDGRIIVTNVPLNRERWVQEFGEEAVNERLTIYEAGTWPDGAFSSIKYWNDNLGRTDAKGRGPKFVIDEAHKIAPKEMRFPILDPRTSQPDMDAFGNQLLHLLTDQGHYLIDNVFITQEPWNVSPRLHGAMHASLYVENAEYKGMSGGYTVKHWNRRLPRNYDQTGAKADDFEKKPKKYNAETWEFFNSQSKRAVKTGLKGRAAEGTFQRSRSVFKRPIVLLMGLAVLWAAYKIYVLYNRHPEPTATAAVAKPATVSTTPAASQPLEKGAVAIDDLGAPPGATEPYMGEDVLKPYGMYLYSATYRFSDSWGGGVGPMVQLWGADLGNKLQYWRLTDVLSAYPQYRLVVASCEYQIIYRGAVVRRLLDNDCLGRMNGGGSASEAGTRFAGEIRPSPDAAPGVPGTLADGSRDRAAVPVLPSDPDRGFSDRRPVGSVVPQPGSTGIGSS